MMGSITLASLLLVAGAQGPIASGEDLGMALSACIRGAAPQTGSEVEIRFQLTARGTLAGRPVVATVRAGTITEAERTLKATMLDALRRCTPFRLDDDFARAIAGRPLTLRVRTQGPAVLI